MCVDSSQGLLGIWFISNLGNTIGSISIKNFCVVV